MIATKSGVQGRKPKTKVPEHLIYEIMDGKPIYYKGYQEVLAGTKMFSEIMGSSALQSFIVAYVQRLLFKELSEDDFIILSSESGLHLDKRNNLAGDILIFDTITLPIEAIDEFYVHVPPKVVIEVDITADPTDVTSDSYIFQKIEKLLKFGVEKVIWITTQAKKVTVATPNDDWQVKDWHKDVEILNGISFNIGRYLTQKGSPFA
ncbi:PDDEXK family nuclease [Spirosoma arboris]|uniref:Uma2 family endonuclease n=1 Tax=Spirosoma arboris TaxID=2682092 RepID=UPI0012F8CAE1|nr:Uma2 family endonuclease [Spirosoma arboris]